METRILEDIGFTKGEIRVYLALLDVGHSTSGPIITKSGIARSKVYEILEKLKQKGLVTETIERNIKNFQAAPPERIKDYIKEKGLEIQKKEQEFDKYLPTLRYRSKASKEEPVVKVYSGFEGIKTMYREILDELKKDDEYMAITMENKAWEQKSATLFFRKFHQQRSKQGIKAKILTTNRAYIGNEEVDFTKTGKYKMRVTNMTLPAGIAIFKNTVATFVWGKVPYVFSIKNKSNAEQYRKFFEEMWKRAK